LTWELARECSEFVNSFVLDSDIVPRLSVNNMERLRDEVLHLIARVKLSKYEIAQRIFWHGVCGDVELGDLDFLIQQNEDMLYAPDNVPDSDFKRQLQRFEMIQQERRSSRGLARSISLYPPGRITHLVKTGQSKRVKPKIACTDWRAVSPAVLPMPERSIPPYKKKTMTLTKSKSAQHCGRIIFPTGFVLR